MHPPMTPPPELAIVPRDRSDTLDSGISAISGSSSFFLQTPSTPAILHVLEPRARSHAKHNVVSSPSAYSVGPSPSPLTPAHADDAADPEQAEHSRLERERALSVGSVSSRMFFIDLEDDRDAAGVSAAGITRLPSVVDGGPPPGGLVPGGLAGYPFPLVLGAPIREPSNTHASMPSSAARPDTPDTPGLEADSGSTKKGMKQAMRAKLERSRSSLRSLSAKLKSGDERADDDIAPNLSGTASTFPTVSKRPSHARLRSLFSLSSASGSRSRSGSVASIRSVGIAPAPSAAGSHQDRQAPVDPNFARIEDQPTAVLVPCATGLPSVVPPSSPDLVEATLVPAFADLVAAPLHRARAASEPLPLSTLPAALKNASPRPDLADASLEGSRATSKAPRRNVDMFGTMLPREIQVMILRKVAEACTARRCAAALTAFKGRKELIKLMRVSRQWRSLCLDGQLWSTIDLVPLAPIIHPATLAAILSNTRHCISSLSLRGLDAVQPWLILNALRPSHNGQLPGLTTLDLRGCRSFTDSDLLHLLRVAPNLRCVNLKGLQRVNRAVLKQMATLRFLDDVDLSRCGVDMDGLVKYLARLSPEQMDRMRVFRCAGLKGHGRAVRDVAVHLGKMRRLEVLDLGGTALDADAVHAWIDAYETTAKPTGLDEPIAFDTLLHLRLTGCEHLPPAALKALTGRLPSLETLELGAMPKFFRTARAHDQSMVQIQQQLERDGKAVSRFLASCVSLRRIDLDDFGSRDGGVSNEMLEALEGPVIREVNIAESGVGVDVECMVRFVRRCKGLKVFNVDSTGADDRVLAAWYKHRHGPDTCLSMLDCRDVTSMRYAEVAQDSRTREGRAGYEYAPFAYGAGEIGPGKEVCGRASLRSAGSRRSPWGMLDEVDAGEEEEEEQLVAEGASALLRRVREADSRESGSRSLDGLASTDDSGSSNGRAGADKARGVGFSGAGPGLIKTAWAWKRIGVARPWREERDKARDAARGVDVHASVGLGSSARGGGKAAAGAAAAGDAVKYAGAHRPSLARRRRRGSWWTSNSSLSGARADGIDGDVDVGGACVVM